MRFGAHVSSSGGISRAIGRGVDLGCDSLQVFTHNPRTWRPIKHTPEEIAAFRVAAAEAGMGPLVSHGLYLINLGAPDREREWTGYGPQDRDERNQRDGLAQEPQGQTERAVGEEGLGHLSGNHTHLQPEAAGTYSGRRPQPRCRRHAQRS